jgi:hypothetical protein
MFLPVFPDQRLTKIVHFNLCAPTGCNLQRLSSKAIGTFPSALKTYAHTNTVSFMIDIVHNGGLGNYFKGSIDDF